MSLLSPPRTPAEAFKELARRQGLLYTESGRLPAATFDLAHASASTRAEPAQSIVSGRLSEHVEGLVCDFHRKPEGDLPELAELTGELDEVPRWATLLLTRVPESFAFAPMLSCYEATSRHWGVGLVTRALLRHVELESINFNKRFRIGVFKEQDENWLRQLFAPSFIDWLAETLPAGAYFELHSGVLSVATLDPPEDADGLERFCALAEHIAQRIRGEAKEREGISLTYVSPHGRQGTLAEQMATDPKVDEVRFDQPPPDVRTAIKRHLGRSNPFLRAMPLVRSSLKLYATSRGFESFMRGWTEARGLQLEVGSEFHSRHLRVPLPGVAARVAAGTLPGGLDGWLVAVKDPTEGAEHWELAPAVVAVVDPTAASSGNGGLPVRIPAGDPEPGSALLGTFEVGEAGRTLRVREDGEREAVPESREALLEAAPGALREALAEAPGKPGVTVAAGYVVIHGPVTSMEEWTAADLDSLCEAAAPAIRSLRR